jgi:hypothetical protein
MNALKDWAHALLPQAIGIARREYINGFQNEQWVDVSEYVRNSGWWNTPVRGHTVEVIILLVMGFADHISATILPDGNDHVFLQLQYKDVEELLVQWGTVSSIPNGIRVRLPIRAETTIGSTDMFERL